MGDEVALNSFYVVTGGLLIIFNLPFVISILKHDALRRRKEYVIFAGLASGDVLSGLSTLIAGAYRLYLFNTNQENLMITRHECAYRTMIFSITAITVQAFLIFAVSVDRFIAVTYPIKYRNLTPRYSYSVIGACYAITLVFNIAGVASSASSGDQLISASCVGSATVEEWFFTLWYEGRVLLVAASAVLYAFVAIKFTHRSSQSAGPSTTTSANEGRIAIQRRVTLTVGINVIFTVILYIIPATAVIIVRHTSGNLDLLSPIAWL
uniref:G-protein coupled receptors family 1 profile domain-containing protein n=1 Tax=Plectus sambesii TaxID=2011161 RepID=A0A914X982_9BILA